MRLFIASGKLPNMASCTSSSGRSHTLRALGGIVFLLTTAAGAQSYDFRLEKLHNPNPRPGAVDASTSANSDFRAFARTFGAAMTSANLAPPETLGHTGFAVNAEVSVVDFRGATLPTAGAFNGPLLMPSLHIRKGLPWSFELGARAAWVQNSRMGVATFEVKWALNEGYTFLPDIGVRAHISKLLNAPNLDLVAGGVDLSIGKRFAIAGSWTLTPYLGWNLVFVGASTTNVDFDPQATLANSDGAKDPFANLYVFNPLAAKDNAHNRFYGGFRLVAGVFQLGGELSYSLLGKVSEQQADQGVVAYNGTLGLQF